MMEDSFLFWRTTLETLIKGGTSAPPVGGNNGFMLEVLWILATWWQLLQILLFWENMQMTKHFIGTLITKNKIMDLQYIVYGMGNKEPWLSPIPTLRICKLRQSMGLAMITSLLLPLIMISWLLNLFLLLIFMAWGWDFLFHPPKQKNINFSLIWGLGCGKGRETKIPNPKPKPQTPTHKQKIV